MINVRKTQRRTFVSLFQGMERRKEETCFFRYHDDEHMPAKVQCGRKGEKVYLHPFRTGEHAMNTKAISCSHPEKREHLNKSLVKLNVCHFNRVIWLVRSNPGDFIDGQLYSNCDLTSQSLLGEIVP